MIQSTPPISPRDCVVEYVVLSGAPTQYSLPVWACLLSCVHVRVLHSARYFLKMVRSSILWGICTILETLPDSSIFAQSASAQDFEHDIRICRGISQWTGFGPGSCKYWKSPVTGSSERLSRRLQPSARGLGSRSASGLRNCKVQVLKS